MRTQWVGGQMQTRKTVFTRHQNAQHLDSVLPSMQKCEINFCCLNYPSCGILLWPPKLISTDTYKSFSLFSTFFSIPFYCIDADWTHIIGLLNGMNWFNQEWLLIFLNILFWSEFHWLSLSGLCLGRVYSFLVFFSYKIV